MTTDCEGRRSGRAGDDGATHDPEPIGLRRIGMGKLRDHPMNANVMGAAMYAKLKRHLVGTGRYPPLIVRPMPGEEGAFQLLDGHHRRRALQELGHADATCLVWQADDAQALTLLATLNRLAGDDDPKRRAALIEALRTSGDRAAADLAAWLPDTRAQLERLAGLTAPPPRHAAPCSMDAMPTGLTFFLTVAQRQRVVSALESIAPRLEAALLQLIDEHSRAERTPC